MLTEQTRDDEIRRANAQKRIPPDKLVTEVALDGGGDKSGAPGMDGLSCPNPTPEFTALAIENLERWLSLLAEEPRKVALLKLAGYKNKEIAAELQTAPRNVERRLAMIRRIWEEAGCLDE